MSFRGRGRGRGGGGRFAPEADVAVEACATATDSTETAVHILAKEVAHVRDEGHLRDKTRASCGTFLF